MSIPASRGVAEGEELILKSYDEDTGLWTTEANTVTVGALTNGFYPGTFQISHLTTFAAGKIVANDKCTTTSAVNFTGDAAVNGLIFNMTRSLSGRVTRTLAANTAQFIFADTQSASETASLTVKDGSGNVWGSATNAAICGAVNVPLTAPTTLSETLNITATCSGDDTVFTADTNALVTYRLADSTNAFLTAPHVANGNYLLSALVEDATYSVNINSGIAGVADYSVQITADGVDESAQIEYDCNTGTGTGGTGGTGGGGI